MKPAEYRRMRDLEDTHWWYAATHRLVIREMKVVSPGSKVLDAGCGTGGLLSILKNKYLVSGFDVSPLAVNNSLARTELAGLIKLGSVESIPYEDNDFDAVTCIDVLYHTDVENENKALQEMYRVLKPGGILLIQVPAFNCLRGGHDKIVSTRKRYTKKMIKEIVIQNNFEILKISYRFWWLFFPAAIIRYLSRGSEKSDLKAENPTFNFLLKGLSIFGDSFLFHKLPFGTSLLTVGKKI